MNLKMGIIRGVQDQAVTILLNNHQVARFDLELKLNSLDFVFLPEWIKNSANEMTLHLDKVISQFELGTSSDIRPLGVSLMEFSISETVSLAAEP